MKHEIERFGSGCCEHQDLPKHNNWPFISNNRKKRGNFWLALSIGLRPTLADERSVFYFFPFLSYVGFIPVSDHLGIFCDATFRRSFCPRISRLNKKTKFRPRFFVIPFRTKTISLFVQRFLLDENFYFLSFFSLQTNFPKRYSILYS